MLIITTLVFAVTPVFNTGIQIIISKVAKYFNLLYQTNIFER